LHRRTDGQSKQMSETGIDLQDTEAKRRRDAEHCPQHCENIDGVPNRTVDTLADQWKQTRTQRQRQATAECKICQRQSDDDVDCPRMKAPVEEGQHHGLPGRFDRAAGAHRRLGVMLDRFGDAEKQQSDPHASTEQHGKPGEIAVIGLTVVRAKLDVAVTAEHEEDDENQENGNAQNIEPAKVTNDARLQHIEGTSRLFWKNCTEENKSENQKRRDEKNRRIHLYPRTLGSLRV
jgi:hypothetical protein